MIKEEIIINKNNNEIVNLSYLSRKFFKIFNKSIQIKYKI